MEAMGSGRHLEIGSTVRKENLVIKDDFLFYSNYSGLMKLILVKMNSFCHKRSP